MTGEGTTRGTVVAYTSRGKSAPFSKPQIGRIWKTSYPARCVVCDESIEAGTRARIAAIGPWRFECATHKMVEYEGRSSSWAPIDLRRVLDELHD